METIALNRVHFWDALSAANMTSIGYDTQDQPKAQISIIAQKARVGWDRVYGSLIILLCLCFMGFVCVLCVY